MHLRDGDGALLAAFDAAELVPAPADADRLRACCETAGIEVTAGRLDAEVGTGATTPLRPVDGRAGLAALCAAFPLVFIQLFVERTSAASAEGITPQWTPSVLLRDRALLWFTFSGLRLARPVWLRSACRFSLKR